MTLDKMIAELTELRKSVGGDTPVVFSFNGSVESGTFLNISEVRNEPYFIADGQEFYLSSEYEPEEGDTIRPLVHLFSNRDHFTVDF